MKIKTQDLTGPALDWAVAKAEGYDPGWLVRQLSNPNPETRAIPGFSADWSVGGPILDRMKMDIKWVGINNCRASIDWLDEEQFEAFGPTPLVAANRCFVLSRLGAEVDVPDELMEKA